MSSPYLLAMRGNLVMVGYQPDGDSLRSIADDPGLFADLYRGYKIRLGPRDGSAQLRLEGIDAPELHYGKAAQPDGATARDWLLTQVGFTDVAYHPGTATPTAPPPEAVPAGPYPQASRPPTPPNPHLHPGTRAPPR